MCNQTRYGPSENRNIHMLFKFSNRGSQQLLKKENALVRNCHLLFKFSNRRSKQQLKTDNALSRNYHMLFKFSNQQRQHLPFDYY